MGMLTFLAVFAANATTHFHTFYTEQRQHTIDADEGKPALDKQQELNSIFECSSSEIHANAAQVSIT